MSLSAKLLEVQRECPTLGFDSNNPHFKNRYVSLGKVLETVLPLLQAKGVLLMQPLSTIDGKPAITTRFIDTETGDVLESSIPLVTEKETPQAVGSTITYFRRYGALSALGLVGDEDDDAESASEPKYNTSGKADQDSYTKSRLNESKGQAVANF